MSTDSHHRISVHPVADLFPMLPADELEDLAADIKSNGLQQPIVLDSDGVLIDGRNRLAACDLAGVEPSFTELNGSDPVAFILSANLARRHMTKGQRAMAGVMALNDSTVRGTAKIVGVDKAYVSQAGQVLDADPALADQVLAGTIPLNEAYSTIQTRRKETERLTAQREQLRALAPDLDDQVSEEVLKLTEALEEARQRDEERQSRQRAARTNLATVLTYLTSDSVSPEALAEQDYGDIAGDFPADRLQYAAETMRHIATQGDSE